jgi:hypothetical protein
MSETYLSRLGNRSSAYETCVAYRVLVERKGLVAYSDEWSGNRPDTEYILVVSSASSKLMSGSIVGSLRASIVFPVPGEPIISIVSLACIRSTIAKKHYSYPPR